jgi:hypothetical protein
VENAKINRIVTAQSLDNILQKDVLSKAGEARTMM